MLQNEELVAAVLGHIESLRDLLRCSAVNRCWHSAFKILSPTTIEIPGYSRDYSSTNYVDHDTIVQWLQQKHQQQYFDKLQNLSLSLSDYASDDQHLVAASGLAMLMLAGLWPLIACSIDGPFDLYQIAGLLPHTLHHLHDQLDADYGLDKGYQIIDICIFQRLLDLRAALAGFESC